MVMLHDAQKISRIQFPFPYVPTSEPLGFAPLYTTELDLMRRIRVTSIVLYLQSTSICPYTSLQYLIA